jgi:putative intracellular protease/amidase
MNQDLSAAGHRDPIGIPPGQNHIGLLLFDGVEELDAVGPYEVLSHWTLHHPEDGWSVSCISPHGMDVTGAKNLVLGAHDPMEAADLDILIHPGGHGTRRLLSDPAHLD